MTIEDIDTKALRELLDRQAILDCIHRYTRGVDRFDRELILSAYHPDAVDDHGLFVGVAADFVDWAFSFHAEHHVCHHHIVTNHTCDLAGDTAHTETYWLFAANNKQGPPVSLSGGRYIDRFEKRDGRWAIAARVCLIEWGGALNEIKSEWPPKLKQTIANAPVGARDRSDISYQRPLRIDRPSSPRTDV